MIDKYSSFRLPLLIPWAVAAGSAVAAAWLGLNLLSAREEVSALRMESRLAELTLREAGNQLRAERIVLTQQLKTQADLAELKIATLVSRPGNSPSALAVAVWSPSRQEGVFAVEKLPVIRADQDYELWLLEEGQPKPISGGVFAVGANGHTQVRFKPEALVARSAKFAVSVEKKGGAPRLSGPQGDMIVISQ